MFKRFLIIMGLIVMSPITLFAKKEALIVAVGKYRDPNIPRLHVASDIKKMEYLLKQNGFHVVVLRDRYATLSRVVNQLKSYSTLSANDVFLFYDTSHGVQIPDLNSDEADGKDEAFALYDTTFYQNSVIDTRGLLIDDEMDILLSRIKAKKLMITDTCHSGSIHKGFSPFTIKSLNTSLNFHNYKKVMLRRRDLKKPKKLISISASKDSELSIDDGDGGIFTTAIYEIWRNNPNISFKELTYKSGETIKKITKTASNLKPQEPQLYSSDNKSSSEPINLYLQDIEGYLDMVMKSAKSGTFIFDSYRKRYIVGSHISFDIDTQNRKGYLYILNITDRGVDRIYPNQITPKSQISKSRFTFPNKFTIEATIGNPYLRKERTVAYAILSDTIIREFEYPNRINFDTLKKIFGNPNKSSWLDIFSSREISIAKSQFYVKR